MLTEKEESKNIQAVKRKSKKINEDDAEACTVNVIIEPYGEEDYCWLSGGGSSLGTNAETLYAMLEEYFKHKRGECKKKEKELARNMGLV